MNRREALRRTAAITGMAVTSSVASGMLSACKPSGDPDWKPKFLTKDEVNLISAISDTIFPTTETPGALDVHVPEFIDLVLADNVSASDQESFREGLFEFSESVRKGHGSSFTECQEDQRKTIIGEEEDRSYEQYHRTLTKTSYLTIKEFTLLGFFTSEYVMNNMLNYQPIPGRYDGCLPLGEIDTIYVGNRLI